MHLALIVLFLCLAVAFPGLTPCYISYTPSDVIAQNGSGVALLTKLVSGHPFSFRFDARLMISAPVVPKDGPL